MDEKAHPFRIMPEQECVMRLPYLFGAGVDSLEINLSVCLDRTVLSSFHRIPQMGDECGFRGEEHSATILTL